VTNTENNNSKKTGAQSIKGFIASNSSKNLLRIVICGNNNDARSTLIDQLKCDAHLATSPEDIYSSTLLEELDAPHAQSERVGVVCHLISTDVRSFIITNTPDHVHVGRAVMIAASSADVAVLLVDAEEGICPQTRQYAHLLSLIGIKHIVIVIGKIDLNEGSKDQFDSLDAEFKEYAAPLDFTTIHTIPTSLNGDNVTQSNALMPWYEGPALRPYLEQVQIISTDKKLFRFPVQRVNHPTLDYQGASGIVRGGSISVGEEVMVASSLKKSKIAEIICEYKKQKNAFTDDAVTLVLKDDINISCGDVLARPGDLPQSSDQFQAKIIWMHEEALLVGRSYQLKIGTQVTNVQITDIKHVINVDSHEHLAARVVEMNEIAVCNLASSIPISFDAYSDNASMGTFILIDRLTHVTLGIGLIDFGLRRASNLSWQSFETDVTIRSKMKGQTPSILWFTGLSASGKSTIVDLMDRKLIAKGVHTYVLDGDNVRHGLNKDLGFTDADRVENIRRVAEVARLMADAGLVVLASFISPFIRERELAREIAGGIDFYEVFVDTPLEVCEARDPKGLYAKARRGDLANFTGISSPFEIPDNPDLSLPGADVEADALADMVIEKFNL